MFKRAILVISSALLLLSCGTTATSPKVLNTATYAGPSAARLYVNPVQADLEVSPQKISFFMPVSQSIRLGGYDNVVATAVKEALDANGGDVIVGLEKQVKYNEDGEIESINITGYPAKYVNFRKGDSQQVAPEEKSSESSGFGGLIGGKKKK